VLVLAGYAAFQGAPAASLERAVHFYEARQWDQAEAEASAVLKADPRMGDAEVLLGLIATVRSQWPKAQEHFERAVALQPGNPRARSYLGATYLQEKRFPEAAGAFRKALELDPQNSTAQYNLGVIALAQHSPSQALDHFQKVLRANSSDIPSLIGSMESQLLLERIPDAQRSAHELDKLLPDNDPRLFQAASLLAQHGQSSSAIPLLERARRAYPLSYEVSYNLALADLETNQLAQAADVLQPFTGAQGKAEAFDLLGQIEDKRGHSEAAEHDFHEAAQRDPANEDYLFDYGNALLQHGKLESAVTAFRAAVAAHANSWKLRFGLGSAFYLSGDYGSAVQELLEAVRLKPGSATAYFLLGEAYDSAGSQQSAIERALTAYLKTAPHDPWAYYHDAVIHQNEESLRQALRLDPNFAEAYLELGILALAKGQTATAITQLEKAVKLAPALAAAHYRLGLAYQKVGNTERAQAELAQFRSLKNRETYRARVLEGLAAAGK